METAESIAEDFVDFAKDMLLRLPIQGAAYNDGKLIHHWKPKDNGFDYWNEEAPFIDPRRTQDSGRVWAYWNRKMLSDVLDRRKWLKAARELKNDPGAQLCSKNTAAGISWMLRDGNGKWLKLVYNVNTGDCGPTVSFRRYKKQQKPKESQLTVFSLKQLWALAEKE